MVDILYQPTRHQLTLHEDKHRYRVVVAGRRFGKSVFARQEIVRKALFYKPKEDKGVHVVPRFWIVSPTYRQGKEIHWLELKKEIPAELVEKKNEVDLEITLVNGSVLELKGAENEDALRGAGLQGVVLDEAAYQKSNVWSEILQPMLLETNGWAVFIGCVTEDTLILGNGLECIGTAKLGYSKENKQVYGLNGFHRAEQRYGNPAMKTIKVKTKFGFEIEGTPNHKLWTPNGWIRLDEMKRGTPVHLQYNQQVFGDRFENIHFCYFLGLYLAEGNREDKIYRITITNTDKQIQDFLIGMGFKSYDGIHFRKNSKEFWQEVKKYFPENLRAKNKYFTKKILELKRCCLEQVLRGYFDGDGHSDANRARVGCNSASEKLIKQLQILLLNFGVLAKRKEYITKPTKRVKKSCKGYRLEIENYGAWKFFTEIGFSLKRKQEKIKNCKDKNTYKTWNTFDWSLSLPSNKWFLRHNKKVEINSILSQGKNTDLLADEVIEVSHSRNKTYDFVIPNTKQYFTNGFISHNTPKGYNWFYDLYNQGQVQHKTHSKEWKSWRYTSYDNPHVPPTEIDKKKAQISEDTFAQEYLAEFTTFSGRIYKAFKPKNHVIKPIPIAEYWKRYGGYDFSGGREPAALVIIAIDPDNDIWYVIKEIYMKEKPSRIMISEMKSEMEGGLVGKVETIWCDPHMKQLWEDYRDNEFYMSPARKESQTQVRGWVRHGIDIISGRLKVNPIDGSTKLKVFNTCERLIREFEMYEWKDAPSEEISEPGTPIKKNDHGLDALRYFAVSYRKMGDDKPKSQWGKDQWKIGR